MENQNERVNKSLQQGAALIASHHLDEAVETVESALALDFENTEVVAALKYLSFWKDRFVRAQGLKNPFERGEYYLSQWNVFQDFIARVGEPSEIYINALRQQVFGWALVQYREVYKDQANRDTDLLVRIGRCYKGSGDYERARKFLHAASVQRPEDAEILAEAADVLALVGETAMAKALFREAFFLDAGKIDISRLESELIKRLVTAVSERGYSGDALLEWIPIYGFLYGVLSVKRELRSIEYGRLKQSIYELERELRDGTGNAELVLPRLINRYFWLIDHYIAAKEAQGKIDEVLLKIRSVDANVYYQYNA